MSIDPQEWSDKRMEAGSDVEATQVHIDLIRAVIADEATLAPQPVAAAGDVPEWLEACVNHLWNVGGDKDDYRDTVHKHCEAEISRRVAEAVAEKDKRSAELEKFKAYVHKRLDGFAVPTNPDPIETEKTGCRIGPRLDWLFRLCNGKTQQLAASQAEVARLKPLADHSQCHDLCCNGDRRVPVGTPGTSCNCPGFRKREYAELTKLRAEVSRLSRPVEGNLCKDLEDFAVEADRRHRYGSANMHRRAIEAIQSERNAREAAERERDELRAAVNKYAMDVASSTFLAAKSYFLMDGRGGRHATVCDAVLAAFRAEKGKVQA